MAYDIVSPGHVLSMHEEAAAAALLALPHYCQRDLDIWGDNSLLERALREHAVFGFRPTSP